MGGAILYPGGLRVKLAFLGFQGTVQTFPPWGAAGSEEELPSLQTSSGQVIHRQWACSLD